MKNVAKKTEKLRGVR